MDSERNSFIYSFIADSSFRLIRCRALNTLMLHTWRILMSWTPLHSITQAKVRCTVTNVAIEIVVFQSSVTLMCFQRISSSSTDNNIPQSTSAGWTTADSYWTKMFLVLTPQEEISSVCVYLFSDFAVFSVVSEFACSEIRELRALIINVDTVNEFKAHTQKNICLI